MIFLETTANDVADGLIALGSCVMLAGLFWLYASAPKACVKCEPMADGMRFCYDGRRIPADSRQELAGWHRKWCQEDPERDACPVTWQMNRSRTRCIGLVVKFGHAA